MDWSSSDYKSDAPNVDTPTLWKFYDRSKSSRLDVVRRFYLTEEQGERTESRRCTLYICRGLSASLTLPMSCSRDHWLC